MNEALHQISIRAPAKAVFALVADIRRWPDLFPPCKQVAVLHEDENLQRFRITAEANNSLMTWTSERHLDRRNLTVSFRQTEPQSPVTSMEGDWCCTEAGPCQTTLALRHRFTVADDAEHAANARRMLTAIDANSSRELKAIKDAAERSKVSTFQDELLIPASADRVFDLLFRAENWPAFLAHCPALKVLYDDGRNQELLMTVETPSGQENIRTVRVGERPHALRYFQTLPPGLLRTHEGAWLLRPSEAGVLVTGAHTITMIGPFDKAEDEDSALHRAEQAIRRNSRDTLEAIRAYCQRTG